MTYDQWKSTDPEDADPYRDNACPRCSAPEGYRCEPECDCRDCERDACEREKHEDDGREYGHPGDFKAGRE